MFREGKGGIWGKRLTAPAIDQLVCKVLGAVHTNNKADEVRAHHQQDIKDTANSTRVTIPPPFPKLRTENKVEKNRVRGLARGSRGDRGRRTVDGGSALLAMTSGRMKSAASQPHAKSLGLRSCQRATNVKINTLVATSRCVPPSGT